MRMGERGSEGVSMGQGQWGRGMGRVEKGEVNKEHQKFQFCSILRSSHFETHKIILI